MKKYNYPLPEITLKYKSGEQKKCKLTNGDEVYDLLKTLYDADTVEYNETFLLILLNRQNNTIGWVKISSGGICGTVADIRMIFATALKSGAVGIIVSHNHPSGNLKPSNEDVKLTNNIKEAGKILDIQLLDHVIYTTEGFYSFANEGRL